MRSTDVLSYLVDRAAFSRRLYYISHAHRRRIDLGGRDDPARSIAPLGDISLDGAVARVPFASLNDLLGKDAQQCIAELTEDCARGGPWPSDLLSPQDMASQLPQIYLLGLSPAMLAAAEAYLGQSCLYLGATLKVERFPPARGTRLWHMDIEDLRMLRVLVYLGDVGDGDGPLQVIAPDQSKRAKAALGYSSGYVADSRMASVVPPSQWIECVANAGDALIFDGARLFHRAQPPVNRERYSVTFSYTTRRPLQIYRKARLRDRTQRRLMRKLAPELRPYLPRPRLF